MIGIPKGSCRVPYTRKSLGFGVSFFDGRHRRVWPAGRSVVAQASSAAQTLQIEGYSPITERYDP